MLEVSEGAIGYLGEVVLASWPTIFQVGNNGTPANSTMTCGNVLLAIWQTSASTSPWAGKCLVQGGFICLPYILQERKGSHASRSRQIGEQEDSSVSLCRTQQPSGSDSMGFGQILKMGPWIASCDIFFSMHFTPHTSNSNCRKQQLGYRLSRSFPFGPPNWGLPRPHS